MSDYMKMINLRNKLDMDFYNILRYDPEFNFYGGKQEGYYSFSASTCRSKCDYNIRLNFKIYYDDKMRLINEYNKYDSLDEVSDDELEDILTEMQRLVNVRVDALYITPVRNGLGSKIVNILINLLRRDFYLKKMVNKSPKNNINFVEALNSGKMILVRMPQYKFKDYVKNVITTFIITKCWLACELRGE